MKKISLAVLAVALLCAGCAGPAIRNAVNHVETSQELIFPEYLAYVTADPKLDADEKDDRKKLVESARDLVKDLKEAAAD